MIGAGDKSPALINDLRPVLYEFCIYFEEIIIIIFYYCNIGFFIFFTEQIV